MSSLKKLVLALIGFVAIAGALAFLFAGQVADASINGVEQPGTPPMPENITALYETVDAVDLHADPLLK